MVLAWHFVGDRLRDGRPVPPDGTVLRHEGPLVICDSGLHASTRIIDALEWAPGPSVCRVRCAGEMFHRRDKLVCRERTILWRLNATRVFDRFTRRCAQDVVHLWDAPEVVIQYLQIGDETLRDDAKDAARGLAWRRCGQVASAARNAFLRAGSSVQDAAQTTEWAAISVTRHAAITDMASIKAAWVAARARQNRRLTSMVMAARRKEHGAW